MTENEKTTWFASIVFTLVFCLLSGLWFGSCQMKKDAVNKGCARWVADSMGAAKIDWCFCEGEE